MQASLQKLQAVAVSAVSALLISTSVSADVWVFEPSLILDQRIDDNYFLTTTGDGSLSATRAVAELGLNRESQTYAIRGLVRADVLLIANTDVVEEDLDYNQIGIFDVRKRTERSRYGFELQYKLDTPSRDIAADISSDQSIAEDTGLLVTQSLTSNVARREISFEPSFEYDVTRRLQFDADAKYTTTEHDLPSAQNVIYERYLFEFARLPDSSPNDVPLPFNQVTLDDINGGVVTPNGELDDFSEAELDLGLRFKLSRISTLTLNGKYSRFLSNVEVNRDLLNLPFEALIADEQVSGIRRVPRRDSVSTTTNLRLGYERFLTPVLQVGVEGGVYSTTQDNSDLFRPEEIREGLSPEQLEQTSPESKSNGWIANLSVRYDADLTQYIGSFGVDVQPSSVGTQVETQELKGEVRRAINPRLNFGLSARAFEPDRLGARITDRFARRFISFEPRIQWRYTRNWTLSAAYRYRRQKARIDPVSAESNAVLFAIRYTPPSEIRDTARANGL